MARTAPATVELNLAGTWTDITSKVRHSDGVVITRGRADEGSATDPSTCSLTVDNRLGDFSPRNPMGAYYGLIGRNTPIRVTVNKGTPRLVTTSAAQGVTTPDSAALSIVGDIDLRSDARLVDWHSSSTTGLIVKSSNAGQRSYRLGVYAGGFLFIEWSTDGTATGYLPSTVVVPLSSGRQAVRATLDVNNGAAGKTATFYTAPTMAGPWMQLGSPAVQAGTIAVFNGTDPVTVRAATDALVYSASIRNGIDGPEVGNPDFVAQTSGVTSFTDAAGTVWTTFGGGAITNKRQRFIGEVSNWPTRWGLGERDIYAQVEAAGILRRLNQGDAPLRSAYYRAVTGIASDLTGYWPMEDAQGSTRLATVTSKVPRASVMTLFGPTPDLASNTQFVASDPLPVVGATSFTGFISSPAGGTNQAWEVRALVAVPAAGATNLAPLFRVYLNTGNFVDLVYGTGGTLGYNAFSAAGTLLASQIQEVYGQSLNGDLRLVSLEGSATNLGAVTLRPGTDVGNQRGTATTVAAGWPTAVIINPYGTLGLGAVGMGHLYVQSHASANASIFELYYALDAYAGDTAAARFARLCTEQGVPYSLIGDTTLSETMGAQLPRTFLDLLDEAVEVDLGILIEPREAAVLTFRSHTSLFNQDAALALPYSSLTDLAPVDDDQRIRNDITVTRIGGSSVRQTLTVGALSTAAPPAGVGVYDGQVELNLEKDSDLADQAAFRLRLGTVDETRFPVVDLNLLSTAFKASPSLTAAAMDLDQGDLLTISSPPAWLPPDQIRQLAQGFTEKISEIEYSIEVNCTPASVWDVGVYDEAAGTTATRYSSDGSTLASADTSTATSLSVATASGPLWTTDPAEFPFDIVVSGERIRVGAASGASSPQTFSSLTRSVNGVVKAQSAGAAVELFKPAYFAL